jgi:hypothetical protein
VATLEATFPATNHEINEVYLRKNMDYLYDLDGTVVGLAHTAKDGARHFLQVLAISTDHCGCGLGTYMLAWVARGIPTGRSMYVQADTTDVWRVGGGTTSAQAFYEKHGMKACDVEDAKHCIALWVAPALVLCIAKQLSEKRTDGLVAYKCAFDDDDIASLPAEG